MTTQIDLDALVSEAETERAAEEAARLEAERRAELERRKTRRQLVRQGLQRALGAELAQALEAGIEEDGTGNYRVAFTWRERLVRVVPFGASEWRIFIRTRAFGTSIMAGAFHPDEADARRAFLLALSDGARKAEELEADAEV